MTVDPPAEARGGNAHAAAFAECSGLQFVAGLVDGTIRRPSMGETLPFTLLPPEEGKVRLAATPEARFYNLTDTIHGGWIMTMLDTAMSLAAQTTLSPVEACPSHETTAKFVRPMSVASGAMHVIGQVVSRGFEPGYTRTSFEESMTRPDRSIAVYQPVRTTMEKQMRKNVEAGDKPEVVAEAVVKAATVAVPRRKDVRSRQFTSPFCPRIRIRQEPAKAERAAGLIPQGGRNGG